MAELHIFKYRKEVFRKPTNFAEERGINSHSVGGDIIRVFGLFGLLIIYKDRLKNAKEAAIVGDGCIRTADD